MGWVSLPASGVSSGILLMWDKLDVECIEEEVGTYSLSCKFKSVLDQFVWALSGPIDIFFGRITHFLNDRVGASQRENSESSIQNTG